MDCFGNFGAAKAVVPHNNPTPGADVPSFSTPEISAVYALALCLKGLAHPEGVITLLLKNFPFETSTFK
jgi:hypothetical protein